ncbi:hypothetical protein BVRB_003050 [Beta vulgaris subsp. vulgaris]|uniref:Uncharacterized protein n=1 Tax=Beta vulgaris subsp. vulgaris TaxID=3555 RepID=A0A0J8B478_BETVV|nr:hypothetical protein BVRB_003050 [Beta vulgaris subsp. vulgaris]
MKALEKVIKSAEKEEEKKMAQKRLLFNKPTDYLSERFLDWIQGIRFRGISSKSERRMNKFA